MGVSVLEKIFATKHEEVAEAKLRTPVEELRDIARNQDPTRGFRRALAEAPSVALIAEIKKASPSQGLIRADFDPASIAQSYERAGANCLSVLTDQPYFQGSPENLRLARAATNLPVLRKDFLDDPYQLWEARAWGADAVLLIVASLSDQQLIALQSLAWDLEMDALVEVHDEAEAERAIAAKSNLIGINNRDLRTFKTDLGVTARLAPMLASHALVVSESALATHADVLTVAGHGAKAVLIGTTFTSAPNIEAKVREVMGVSA